MIELRCLAAIGSAALAVTPLASGQVFEVQPSIPIGIFDLGCMVYADVDGVNGPDLVFCTDSGSGLDYAVALNDGSGEITFDLGLPGGVDGSDVVAGDWDADGFMDVIGLEPAGGDSRLRLQRQVSIGDWEAGGVLALTGERFRIVAADVSGDALVDLVVGYPAAGLVEVYINDASGGVGGLAADAYAAGAVVDIVCCDFDADGRPDLATIDAGGQLRVRLNQGAGAFGPVSVVPLGSSLSSLACSDLSGDGFPDLAVTRTGDDAVSVLLGDGAGGFSPGPPIGVVADPVRVACGDFDCDGDVDLAVASDSPGSHLLQVLFNAGTGVSWLVEPAFATSTVPIVDLHVVEWNGEPGDDLLAVRHGGVTTMVRHYNAAPACSDCIEPPDDVVAWYAGGDFCTPEDVTGNYDGSFVGLPFCPIAKVGGGALGFDDAPPTYVEVSDACELDPGDGGFTVDAWVRTNAAGLQPIAAKGGAPGYELSLSSGQPRVVICDATFCWITRGSSLINDGDWHHVAFTLLRGPSSVIRLWVDGVLEDETVAVVGTLASSHPLLLGAAPSPSPSSHLVGALDEVQVFSRPLLASEVQSIYLAGIAGQCVDVCAPSAPAVPLDTAEFVAGAPDGFALPSEPATPGAVLGASCAGAIDFDVTAAAAPLCHTFNGLPAGDIIGASLEIRLKGAPFADPCDDAISLQATGGTPAFLWSRSIGAPDGCASTDEGLLCDPWTTGSTHTFCLDLADLPELSGPSTSVIASMNSTGRLDVRVGDETAVDSMRLRLALCDCPPDITNDCEVGFPDLLAVLSAWGPCAACPQDVTEDGTVGFADLIQVLSSYGPCE